MTFEEMPANEHNWKIQTVKKRAEGKRKTWSENYLKYLKGTPAYDESTSHARFISTLYFATS